MIEITYGIRTADQLPDPAVTAALDTAAWTAGLTIATWFLVAGAFAAALFALLTWLDTKKQLAEAQAQTAAAKAQAGAAETQATAAAAQLSAAAESAEILEASKVSAWLKEAQRVDSKVLELFVRNGNDGPVFDAKVNFLAKPSADDAGPRIHLRSWVRLFLAPDSAAALKPSDEIGPQEFVAGQDYVVRNQINPVFADPQNWKIWDGKPDSVGLALELSFRDSAGIYWKRDWHGKLSKMATAQPE